MYDAVYSERLDVVRAGTDLDADVLRRSCLVNIGRGHAAAVPCEIVPHEQIPDRRGALVYGLIDCRQLRQLRRVVTELVAILDVGITASLHLDRCGATPLEEARRLDRIPCL